jgi:hypothetical protein
MADVSHHSLLAPARAAEKSYDIQILVAAGLLAIGLLVTCASGAVLHPVAPINLDLVLAYP